MNWSAQTIEMHFQEIQSLTDKMKSLSEALSGIGKETIPDAVCAVKRGWNSESGKRLMERELKLGMQIREEAERLSRLSKETQKQAEEMYRAEQANSRLASVRSY
ncbi:MAG: hypothetical protein NC429_10415 [Lachnospiraceae bacterium]|nr:hypothetical protein [Lachnospiraceae bacterium]